MTDRRINADVEGAAQAALAHVVAQNCSPAAWRCFRPALSHLGSAVAFDEAGSPPLGPGVWVRWLSLARPDVQARAQALLRAMSLHRWHLEVAPPSAGRANSLERLRVLISVQRRSWVVTLAAHPEVHVMALAPVLHLAVDR